MMGGGGGGRRGCDQRRREGEGGAISKFLFLPSSQIVEINESNKFITVSIFPVRHTLHMTFLKKSFLSLKTQKKLICTKTWWLIKCRSISEFNLSKWFVFDHTAYAIVLQTLKSLRASCNRNRRCNEVIKKKKKNYKKVHRCKQILLSLGTQIDSLQCKILNSGS